MIGILVEVKVVRGYQVDTHKSHQVLWFSYVGRYYGCARRERFLLIEPLQER